MMKVGPGWQGLSLLDTPGRQNAECDATEKTEHGNRTAAVEYCRKDEASRHEFERTGPSYLNCQECFISRQYVEVMWA